MTATRDPDLLENLQIGVTYLVSADPYPPTGDIQWQVKRYQAVGPDAVALGFDASLPVWQQIPEGARLTAPMPEYRAAALEWLREVTGLDAASADVVLMLPDCVERLRPDGA